MPDGVRMELAEEIADRLTMQLREIEVKAQKVDTLIFALQLAFDYALRHQQQAEAHQSEQADLVRELLAVNELLESLLKIPTSGATPPPRPAPLNLRRSGH